jgi:hypothetical protein
MIGDESGLYDNPRYDDPLPLSEAAARLETTTPGATASRAIPAPIEELAVTPADGIQTATVAPEKSRKMRGLGSTRATPADR